MMETRDPDIIETSILIAFDLGKLSYDVGTLVLARQAIFVLCEKKMVATKEQNSHLNLITISIPIVMSTTAEEQAPT
eukprot:scaffold741_cov41-Attheya_sp.AAC.1